MADPTDAVFSFSASVHLNPGEFKASLNILSGGQAGSFCTIDIKPATIEGPEILLFIPYRNRVQAKMIADLLNEIALKG